MAEQSKVQHISEIIEEVQLDICNNYCKYADQAHEEDEGYLEGICDNCPLNRL